MAQTIQEARQLLAQSNKVTVLTGAGISAESGVPTFRGAGGHWKGRSAMDLATPEGFAKDPAFVWSWYNERRNGLSKIEPNSGHHALVTLEKQGKLLGIATQNVDGLHQTAGSQSVLELHGSIWQIRCTSCHFEDMKPRIELEPEPKCPSCGSWLRPGVVWFGEALPEGVMEQAAMWVSQADLLMVVGTSAAVYPAAGLIDFAKDEGSKTMVVNLEPTSATARADISLLGKSGEILPQIITE